MMLMMIGHLAIFLCHGGWALRTPSPSSPSSSASSFKLTAANSPTAEALSSLFYPKNSTPETDTYPASSSSPSPPPTSATDRYKTKRANLLPISSAATSAKTKAIKVVSVETNCTRDLFDIQLNLNKPFRGLLFAKDFPAQCRQRGTGEQRVSLQLPTSGCGVRSETKSDGSGNLELLVQVLLQMDGKLRQSTDILKVVRCKMPQDMMSMNVLLPSQLAGGDFKQIRNGRMRSTQSTLQRTQPTPRVRIWLELYGPDGTGSVEVGQPTVLAVRAVVPGSIGVRVVDCSAHDGLGQSAQQLLDQRGCPIDEQVMPGLQSKWRPAEEGWSKLNDDDIVEKLHTATFAAFKFPDRDRLHVSCSVQLCKGNCSEVNCATDEKFIVPSDKFLARIEVFNSLAVSAPQIEIDRLRYDHNISAEEYPPQIHRLQYDGMLCLSISKLAISLCVLGLIFLLAVMFTVCFMIRSRKINASYREQRANSNSIFSSSSDSSQSALFGSKLFIPYYQPGALPYGRVF